MLKMESKIIDQGISINRAAELMGYSPSTIRRLCKKGELAGYGNRKMFRIYMSSIELWRDRNQSFRTEEDCQYPMREYRRATARHKAATSKLQALMN